MAEVDGRTYYLSTRADKKLMVRVNGKLVHFGQAGAEHYYDRSGLLPPALNHGDAQRREDYLKRSGGIRDAYGFRTADNPTKPNYHARRVLWASGIPVAPPPIPNVEPPPRTI